MQKLAADDTLQLKACATETSSRRRPGASIPRSIVMCLRAFDKESLSVKVN
jgi:hypothetical protein